MPNFDLCEDRFIRAVQFKRHEENEHKAYPGPKCSEEFETVTAMNQAPHTI